MKRCQAGFTLVEVMIAITIMAILSVISWRALDSVTRSDGHLRDADTETTAALRVLQQFQRDIEMRADTELLNGALRPADVLQRLLPPSLASTRDPGGAFAIEVTRSIGSDGQRWQRVRWFQQGRTLRRASGAPGTEYPLPAPALPGAITVARDVQRFDVRAWQPAAGWNSLPANGEALPAQGLEMTLVLRDARGPQVYRRVLPLQ